MAAFEPLVKEGKSVLCICLNAAFSGSYQAAVNARTMVLEEYPQGDIRIVDSRQATVLQGVLVQEAVRLRDEGLDMETAAARLEAVRSTGRIFFTTNDLKYLANGGRIGKAAAATGTILQMKPMIELYDAELNSAGVVRGRKKSLQRFQEMFREYVEREQIDLKDYIVVTGYGYDYGEYEQINEQVAAMLAEMGVAWEKPCDYHIGVTIGVHTGPHPIGMAIMRRA
jgi:DegV family protein with EDD domain